MALSADAVRSPRTCTRHAPIEGAQAASRSRSSSMTSAQLRGPLSAAMKMATDKGEDEQAPGLDVVFVGTEGTEQRTHVLHPAVVDPRSRFTDRRARDAPSRE